MTVAFEHFRPSRMSPPSHTAGVRYFFHLPRVTMNTEMTPTMRAVITTPFC